MTNDEGPHFQRARQPEQVRVRRESIMVATAKLFEMRHYDEISLNDIALEVGLSKSNIYRYFEGREDIFLHMLEEEGWAWGDRVVPLLEAFAGRADVAGAASTLTSAFVDSERYCRLISDLGMILRGKLSEKRVGDYLTGARLRRDRLADAIATALPGRLPEQTRPLMIPIFSLVAGLWIFTHVPSILDRVYSMPEFADLRLDFDEDLHEGITRILDGLMSLPAGR